MRRLKILLVHERFPPDYAGGGEYVVLKTAQCLQARGHSVGVVTAGDPSVIEFEGIRTERLPVSRYGLNMAWRRIAAAACDVDLIHTFTYNGAYPAFRAARHLGKPVVFGILALFGDVWREMRGPIVGRVFQTVEQFLLRLPMDASIYLSEASQTLAGQLGAHRAIESVIPPGVSLADYRADPDKSCVMFAGKLDVRKGIETVLQIARQMPDVPFHLVGWGGRYAEVERSCPANVRIEPFKDRLHLAGALSKARIFLFPTKAETFGLIVAEAMASGCAVVSTSPLPFEGVRIPPDDAEAALKGVRDLWGDRERCARAGLQNQRNAQQYSWDNHVDQLENVYRQALDCRA